MTTLATATAAIRHPAGAYDRVFYTGMAVAMALTVFAGFAPTYYLRGYFGAPVTVSGAVTLSPLAYLHGAVFTAWVVLFLAQTWLVASRRVAVHRRLGMAGVALAAAMVVVGISTAIRSAASGGAPTGIDPLAFLLIPVSDMVLFAGFVTAAVLKRRDRETHKRLMLLAYVSIITAAIARLPGVAPLGPLAFFGLSLLFVVAGAVYDRWSRGRIHPVYLWGGALLAVSIPARLALSGSAAWLALAERLVR
jgi:hypothetical protein